MPYTIKKSNGETVVVIPDGAIDGASTSLNLVGKNVSGYGFYQNENFVYLLENFAKALPPEGPVEGQVWYDTTAEQLKVYTGSSWKGISNNTVSETAPTASLGDLWFDSVNKQLKMYTGTGFDLVGTSVPGFAKSRFEGATIAGIKDGESEVSNNPVLNLYIDGNLVGIVSRYEFTPSVAIAGLHQNSDTPGRVFIGVNLVGFSTINGIADQANKFVDAVDGALPTTSFVRTDAAQSQVVDNSFWAKDTLLIGTYDGNPTLPLVTVGNYIGANASPDLDLQITSAGNKIVITLDTIDGPTDILAFDGDANSDPSRINFSPIAGAEVDLGTSVNPFRNVRASNFIGDVSANDITATGTIAGNVNSSIVRVDTLKTRDGITTAVNLSNNDVQFYGTFNGDVAGSLVGESADISGDATIAGSLTVSTITVTGGSADGLDITGGTLTSCTIESSTINNATVSDVTLTGTPTAPTADILTSDSQQVATTAFVHNIMPLGVIVMWSGDANNIPTGWVLCDGVLRDNGIRPPDLRSRFVIGAGTIAPHQTGGNQGITATTQSGGYHSHTGTANGTAITAAQMPSHGHLFDDIRWSEVSGTNSYNDPQLGVIPVGSGAGSSKGTDYDNGAHFITHGTYNTGGGQAHVHTLTIAGEEAHTHSLSIADTRPPYYALCYIMKAC